LLRILALAGRFFSVPACVTLSRCRPSYCAVHGRIADGRPCGKDGRYAQLRRSACTVAAVGAHRRLFHGRPRTGQADRIFPGLRRASGGAGHASPVANRQSARLPGASRPDEAGDRRQCSPWAQPWVGRQLSGSQRYPGPPASTTPLPSGRRRSDPFRGGYHGTWLTPSARRYRIHPERRVRMADYHAVARGFRIQISRFWTSL
jgi:hypothetical protein